MHAYVLIITRQEYLGNKSSVPFREELGRMSPMDFERLIMEADTFPAC